MDFIFVKVNCLHDIIKNGVMDYLIKAEEISDPDLIQNFSIASANQNILEGQRESDNKNLIPALELDKLKPADRVTFLLNYLYLTIKNNELLSNF